MSFLNWIDRLKNIPVNVLCTWWSCNRSFISPSVFHIEHHHKFTIWNFFDEWGGARCLIPLEGSKEFINNTNLMSCNSWSWFGNREHNSHCCCNKTALFADGQMNCMHFNILSNSINCMFRSSVEMELNTVISGSCFVSISTMFRVNLLSCLSWFSKSNLRSVSIPNDFNFDFLICVHLVEIIEIGVFHWPSSCFEINWTLICTGSTNVTCDGRKTSPVFTISFVVP